MSRPHWYPAYIGIGSNLDSPIEQVKRGIGALRDMGRSVLIARSCLYRSSPVGLTDQPDFINAVASLLTQLEPHALLNALNKIEDSRGRLRDGPRWGPRTLDLDLLSYGSVTMADDVLILPHPRIAERNFVLLPWREIAPHYIVPGLATVTKLSENLGDEISGIEILDEE